MKKFDNVEMMEEELDNVVGGQKTATIEHPEDGHTSIPTLDIEHDEIKTKENEGISRCYILLTPLYNFSKSLQRR